MNHRLLYGSAALSAITALAVVYGASHFGPQPANAQTSAQAAYDSVNTAKAVAAAKWSDNVTITINDDDTFTYQSNGMPSHGFAEAYLIPKNVGSMPFSDNTEDEFDVKYSAEYFSETPLDQDITTLPMYIDATTDTSLGQIGVAISGAQIFNDYEDPGRTIAAMDDNIVFHDHVAFVDECNGHTLVNGTNYHYHGIPTCITEALDVEGEHSYMLGVLVDGFPVYANQDTGGAIIGDDALDECSGHFGATPEFPDGIYHYHLTADDAPYMIDCYHGEVDAETASGGAQNPENGGGPDLSSAAETLGVTEAELLDALGGGGPPDFAAAATALGVSEDAVRAAMPAPPN
jgi:hypothetical protein